MANAEETKRLIQELAWTRERLLLMPRSTELPPTFAQSYETLAQRKLALESEIAALAGRGVE